MAQWGVIPRPPEIPRGEIDRARFFDQWGWDVHRDIPAHAEYTGKELPRSEVFHQLAERLFWTPLRAHDDAARKMIFDALLPRLPPLPVRAELPGDLRCRIYRRRENGYVVHVMPTAITTVPHESYRFQGVGDRIVREVHYAPLQGKIVLTGDFTRAELYSPDLAAPRLLTVCGGRCEADLTGLRRFFSVRLQ